MENKYPPYSPDGGYYYVSLKYNQSIYIMKQIVVILIIFLNLLFNYISIAQKTEIIHFNEKLKPWIQQNASKNIKGAKYISKQSKFTIVLYDLNNNGIYNEIGKDMVFVVSDTAKGLIPIPSNSATLLSKNSHLIVKADKYMYSVHLNGDTTATIKRCMDSGIKPDIILFDELPEMNFSLLDGGKSSFVQYEHHHKYLYVEFWGTWCAGCMETLDSLNNIVLKHSNNLTVIGMDYLDPGINYVKKVIKEHKLSWIEGISNDSINSAFHVFGYPYGVLFAPDGTLIYSGLTIPKLIEQELNNLIFAK